MKEVLDGIRQAGMRIRAFSTAHVPELAQAFSDLGKHAQVDGSLYAEVSGFLSFAVPDFARSVLVVAMPVPMVKVAFHLDGGIVKTVVPPTYAEYGKAQHVIEERLNGWLSARGYRAAWARCLPEKLCAAHSGLACYGRNNICYVDGMGSFALLSAYHSDMPCDSDDWQAPRRMAMCDHCRRCVKACPTGAIVGNRRIIDAGLCITRHNEYPGEAFPDFMQPHFHNSAVGCMHCQTACPANAGQLDRVVMGGVFDKAETAALLEDREAADVPEPLMEKLRAVGLAGYHKMLRRNLLAISQGGGYADTPAIARWVLDKSAGNPV